MPMIELRMHCPKWFESVAIRETSMKRSSMNALTGGDKRDQKLELSLSIQATINSKITCIPAKNNIR